jgi:hypothetical protein
MAARAPSIARMGALGASAGGGLVMAATLLEDAPGLQIGCAGAVRRPC